MQFLRTLAALSLLYTPACSAQAGRVAPDPPLDEFRVLAKSVAKEPEQALPALLGYLESEHPRVRLYAAEVLHRSFDPHRAWNTSLEASRLALFEGVFSKSNMAPIYVAIAQKAVPALVRALDDDQSFVRAHAAATLAKLGVDAKEAEVALRAKLRDPDPIAKYWMEHALARVAPPAHADLLVFRSALLESAEAPDELTKEERAFLIRRIEESSEWDLDSEGWWDTESPNSPNQRFEAAKEIVLHDLPALLAEASGEGEESLRAALLLDRLRKEVDQHFSKLITFIEEGFGFGTNGRAYKDLLRYGDASVLHVTWAFLRRPRFPIGAPTYLAHLSLIEELGQRMLPCLVDGLLHFRDDFANEQAAFRMSLLEEQGLPALPFILADWRFGGHDYWDRAVLSGEFCMDVEKFGGHVVASFGPAALPYFEAELDAESDPLIHKRLVRALRKFGGPGRAVLKRHGFDE